MHYRFQLRRFRTHHRHKAQGTYVSLENGITRDSTQADIIAVAGEPNPAYAGESDVLLIIDINDARRMDLRAADGDEGCNAKAPVFDKRGLLAPYFFGGPGL